MLKLHGFAVSNYFNMVRMALAAKGIEYEIVKQYPSQGAGWIKLSPVGKVPCLETPQGTLTETIVILEYLEDAYPDKPFFPSDPFERAQVRQAMHMIKLYVELPARRLFPGVFFGGNNSDKVIEEVKPVLERGVSAVNALASFDPYLMGSSPTAADYMFMYTMDLADQIAHKVYDWDLVGAMPGASQLLRILGEDPAAQRIAEEKREEMTAFLTMRAGN